MKGLLILLFMVILSPRAITQQVEHVPFAHPVQDYLDRLGVRGILPLESSSVRPIERREARRLLDAANGHRELLSSVERATLDKFRTEFAGDLGARFDQDVVLLGPQRSIGALAAGLVSDREKHLFAVFDSSASLVVDLLASVENRSFHRPGRSTDVTLGNIGGRFRGTLGGQLGYMLQATNGVMMGDRALALADPRLAGNFKLNDVESANFDFTEAYLRLSFGWAGIQFGREFTSVGTGYGDRLLLSGNAPALDFFSVDARYRSFRFFFLHGAIRGDDRPGTGLIEQAPANASKYLAMHRFQFSLFDVMNIGASEMVVYQRLTPEYAYLLPINFFKSAEHQLRDRDNALLAFDIEVFPLSDWKFYGTWVIDDITISRMGTGWWGNEFGWQAGVCATNVLGWENVDAILEFQRLEPYVYSNRTAGNDMTHSNVALGTGLPPNADEVMAECRWLASPWLTMRVQAAYRRHGMNVMQGDSLLRNVGGSAVQGHRGSDPETAMFLDGVKETLTRVTLALKYEPVRELYLTGSAEWLHRVVDHTPGSASTLGLRAGITMEY